MNFILNPGSDPWGFYIDMLGNIDPGYATSGQALLYGVETGNFVPFDVAFGNQIAGVLGPLDLIGVL